MEKSNVILEKSYSFALNSVKFARRMQAEEKEFVISKQFLRSSTSIGANLEEAQDAQSKMDFIHKLSISLKECRETYYWLRLLHDAEIGDQHQIEKLKKECIELKSILTSIIKTLKSRL